MARDFAFELIEFGGKLFVAGDQISQMDKSSDYMDAYFNSTLRIQHACSHDGTVFCENKR